jgi:hypothetical protein
VIAASVLIASIFAFGVGYLVGRLPHTPTFYSRPIRAPHARASYRRPTSLLVEVEPVHDRRADISLAMRKGRS